MLNVQNIITSVIVAALLANTASASEGPVVWRSASSGVLTTPTPTAEPPATPPVEVPVVTYGGNRYAWGVGESVLLLPDVSGGSGRYEYALATATPLPAGLSFDSATGIFSGRPRTAGQYQWSILMRDMATGARTTAVAVAFFVE
nr:Ig domain-containing protein [Rhizobium sp. ACO-34A]